MYRNYICIHVRMYALATMYTYLPGKHQCLLTYVHSFKNQ